MKPILEIENISKLFKIQHRQTPYLNFRDELTGFFNRKEKSEEFWALKNVSFTIDRGDSLGIIGRNGAGKSTLLKVLSRITPPTEGRIITRGRVTSLLEVGTGFHQELTGRENIFMNGSIMGLKRREIHQRFDEIVSFSGTEKFLDTPLKHYSSGMQLRLAFAVAAHLEPDILIIDEVLAVGDAEFQKKCIGKMEDVSKGGRTLLFVSHNLQAVERLCRKSIVIDQGWLKVHGETKAIVQSYLDSVNQVSAGVAGTYNLRETPGKKNKNRGFQSAQLFQDNVRTNLFQSGSNFRLELSFDDEQPIKELVVGFVIKDHNMKPMIGINNWDLGLKLNKGPVSAGKIIFEIERLPLYGDENYYLDLYFGDGGENHDILENAVSFKLEPRDLFGHGRVLSPALNAIHPGNVHIGLV